MTSNGDTAMANNNLNGKRVAILATDGVEQTELTEPRKALDQAGAKTVVVSPKSGKIRGWQHDHWGDEIPVDQPLDSANADTFDALMRSEERRVGKECRSRRSRDHYKNEVICKMS